MKKMRMIIVCMLVMVLSSACSATIMISEKDAMHIALHDAGLSADDTIFVKQEFDKDDGEYSFKFVNGEMFYEYDINGFSGVILNREKKQCSIANRNVAHVPDPNGASTNETIPNENKTSTPDTSDNQKRIPVSNDTTTNATINSVSEDQWSYVQVALDYFAIQRANVSNLVVENDTEHGIETYDIKLYVGLKKYKCEIRKDTKQIIESEVDYD